MYQNPYLIKFTITLTKIKNFLKKMSFQLVFKTDYSLGICLGILYLDIVSHLQHTPSPLQVQINKVPKL